MEISATVNNSGVSHVVTVRTDGSVQSVAIPAKRSGQGSGVNGGAHGGPLRRRGCLSRFCPDQAAFLRETPIRLSVGMPRFSCSLRIISIVRLRLPFRTS